MKELRTFFTWGCPSLNCLSGVIFTVRVPVENYGRLRIWLHGGGVSREGQGPIFVTSGGDLVRYIRWVDNVHIHYVPGTNNGGTIATTRLGRCCSGAREPFGRAPALRMFV